MTEKKFILFAAAIIILAVSWIFIAAQNMIEGKGTKGYTMAYFKSGGSEESADALSIVISNETNAARRYDIEYNLDGKTVAAAQTDIKPKEASIINPPDELMEEIDRLPAQSALVRIIVMSEKQKEELYKMIKIEN